MSLLAIAVILGALIGLRFLRVPMIAWLLIWPLAVYAFLNFGITVPIPSSVEKIYLSLTILALIVYILADHERYAEFRDSVVRFVTEERYSRALVSVVVGLPLLVALKVYFDMQVEVRAPSFARTVHPAPPGDITFNGKKIDLIRGKNPYRELEGSNPEEFRAHVENGKRVYHQNCVFCHGDDMAGDGIFAHAFNPVPAEFSNTTIGMLQESYLFWRIAKGGPGLPYEGGPWSSAMPAWEKFLSEEEIWDVILYLYDYTGLKPRAEEEHH